MKIPYHMWTISEAMIGRVDAGFKDINKTALSIPALTPLIIVGLCIENMEFPDHCIEINEND